MSLRHVFAHAFSFALTIALAPGLRADLDREKKDAKDAGQAKPILDEDAHEHEHAKLIEEGRKNLEEIDRLLKEIQGDLSAKNTGGATQGRQKEVVERIQKLIQELDKGCSSCSSSSSKESKNQQKSGGASAKENPRQRQISQDEKDGASAEERQRKERERQLQAQQQQREEEKRPQDGRVENDRTQDGAPPQDPRGALADRIREAQRWGILPPKVAEAMLYSSGKEAPQEYREIIARYYKRLTEVQTRGR